MFKTVILTLTALSLTSVASAEEKLKASLATLGGEVNAGHSNSNGTSAQTIGLNARADAAAQQDSVIMEAHAHASGGVGTGQHHSSGISSGALSGTLGLGMAGGFKMTNTLCAPYAGLSGEFEARGIGQINETSVVSRTDGNFSAKAGLACSDSKTLILVTPQASAGARDFYTGYSAIGGRAMVILHNRLVAELEYNRRSFQSPRGVSSATAEREDELTVGAKYVIIPKYNLWAGADLKIADGQFYAKNQPLVGQPEFANVDSTVVTIKTGVAF